MTTNYIGKSIKRREDNRFLTGKGKYTDDIKLPGMCYAAFVRSPYAHAKILSIDKSGAEAMDGIMAIYTGEDECSTYSVPCGWQVDFKNGDTMKEPPHPLLAKGKALHVGENVAVIIAKTLQIARDAAEAVEVEYEELDAVTNPRAAVQPGAPQ
ncbi:MAG: carbon-monoxide dehydrogenase large subunit, partial [Saprospiraceae bacterium]